MAMDADLHAHSSDSDGGGLPQMVSAAAKAGLRRFDGPLQSHGATREEKPLWNRNFDRTYERRREAITILEERAAITIHDGIEVDYEARLGYSS